MSLKDNNMIIIALKKVCTVFFFNFDIENRWGMIINTVE